MKDCILLAITTGNSIILPFFFSSGNSCTNQAHLFLEPQPSSLSARLENNENYIGLPRERQLLLKFFYNCNIPKALCPA